MGRGIIRDGVCQTNQPQWKRELPAPLVVVSGVVVVVAVVRDVVVLLGDVEAVVVVVVVVGVVLGLTVREGGVIGEPV